MFQALEMKHQVWQAETTRTDRTCMVCNSGGASMMLLSCKHLHTRKPCAVHLTACPICGAVKDDRCDRDLVHMRSEETIVAMGTCCF